jgi:hypothetical protein
MKKQLGQLLTILTLTISVANAQSPVRTEKVGHVFSITVPDYLTRTIGINDAASVEFKNEVKEVYTFVIEDSKADLELVDMKFTDVKEFYENFIKDFLADTKERTISAPKSFEKDGVKFVQFEATYYDKDVKGKIYYNITIAETKGYFYKIMSYTTEANKTKLRDDLFLLGTTIRD